MILYDHYVAFQEVPDEISLALNISECPHLCKGCHSKWLWSKKGTVLTEELYIELLNEYDGYISCVCFMGGEWDVDLSKFLSIANRRGLVTCLYTGALESQISDDVKEHLRYLKVGKYEESLGGLQSPNTNQKFIDLINHTDITSRFYRN